MTMTRLSTSPAHDVETLLVRQLAAIDAWNAARRQRELALDVSGASRETRLDGSRRRESLARTHAALVARTHDELSLSPSMEARPSGPRVVVAHRQPWFAERVCEALRAEGADVVAVVDNGADAVGTLVAVQPHLLLVEEFLPLVTGAEVVAEAALFAPRTLVVAQVAYAETSGLLREAGAHAVVPRSVSPAGVATGMLTLVGPTAGHRLVQPRQGE